jgi:hypothetical protein
MKTRKPDRDRGSAEPWEVERLHREFPVESQQELEQALEDCKSDEKQQQDKSSLTRCVQRKASK